MIVTEVMYDPDACADTDCEWVEIRNETEELLDVDGLVVEDAAAATGTVVGTAVIAPGGHAVLGRSDAETFGYASFVPLAFYGGDPPLDNDGDETVALRDGAGTLLDTSEEWTGQGAADNGIAFKRNEDGSWCYSPVVFEDADRGSPGEPNEEACALDLPGGATCDLSGGPIGGCLFGDPDACSCVGCVDDDICGLADDCVCADCDGSTACDDCVDDGACDPYAEGCACDDCAGHILCATPD